MQITHAAMIYNESNGLVVIEMENTDSALGQWDFIETNTAGYPSGAIGAGHLEYTGPFSGSAPVSPLVYRFKINQSGRYDLRFRAHKRLLGNPGDKNNDAFVKMSGNYTSGNSSVPLSALLTDTKLFGGGADNWNIARKLDGNGAHLQDASYNFIAGEVYTFTVSGRSTRFNLDRILFHHESVPFNFSDLSSRAESSLINLEPPPTPTVVEFRAPDFSNGELNNQQGWSAENSWIVADTFEEGHASTSANNEIATHGAPITLEAGESFGYSINFEFLGNVYSTPSAFTYAFLTGLKVDSTSGSHVSTGDAVAADANVQIINATDDYRLLSNFKTITGASSISGTELNPGDVLQLDYELTLGIDAASSFYTVRLQNLTDGTDTGIGVVDNHTISGTTDTVGIHPDMYAALTGDGAHTFFQSINPGNGNSGLAGVQVHSISFDLPNVDGDHENDGDVDGSDFLAWQRDAGSFEALSAWQGSYPTNPILAALVPEPSSLATMFTVLAIVFTRRVFSHC